MTRTRKTADVRKEELLAAALKLAQLQGIRSITREDVARAVDVAQSLVTHHFNTMKQFNRALVRYAIKQNNVIVVAQAVAANYIELQDISDSGLRGQVYNHLSAHNA